jgi:NAD(P)-dependent dehydrogenase (short-subunit alcohol dehydrogenase family)
MIPRASSRTRKLDEARLSSVDLAGKTALVTGATSGLGEATARALAARGARVVLGVRDLRAGARVAREIRDSIEGCPEDRVVVPTTPLDLASNASVAAFAREVSSTHARSLDVLVNNAGVNFLPESFTPEGIGVIAQINFLGPAVLTRLLEEPLSRAAERSGVAAVVHVSSVTHRYAAIAPDASAFLRTWEHGSYAASKLANVVFANECQRRWWDAGKRIVSVAVDPGAVFSNLWLRDKFFSKPPALFLLRKLYAPPTDGATAVVFACLVPFHEEGNEKSENAEESGNADLSDGSNGSDANLKTSAAEAAAAAAGAYFPRDIPRESPKTKTKASLVRTGFEQETLCRSSRFRFYARGLFATELVVRWGPKDVRDAKSLFEKMKWFTRYAVWGVATLLCSALDWPMRRLFSTTAEVPSSPGSYDERTGAALWEEAGKAAGLAGR